MSALRTAANIFFPDPFHQIRHPETGIPLLKLLVSLKFKNKLQIFGFHAIVKKAVIMDFLETGWKHMHCRRAYTWNGFVEMLKYYPLAKPKTYYCLY